MNKCDEQKQELSKMSGTEKKTEGKAFKNRKKQEEYESQIEKDMSISDVNSITAQRINSANFLKKVLGYAYLFDIIHVSPQT